MQIILYIVLAFLALGIIGIIIDWIKNNKAIVVIIVLGILSIAFLGFGTTLFIIGMLVVLGIIIGLIVSSIQKSNDGKLNEFLNNNCVKCGYVNEEIWKKILPQFKDKMYTTSFEEITRNFADKIENKYIESDSKLEWLDPAVIYLTNNIMADVIELEKVKSENLQFTHNTPNGKLIYEAMEYLCLAKVINGKHMIQKIKLEDESIRKQLKIDETKPIPEYYRTAYKIADYFTDKRKNNIEGNIDSEEISFDDL